MSDRHSRQERFAPIGAAGQARLAAGRVLVAGVGALGSAVAEILGRAGVGRLRLVDRDVVERSNLQRQALYVASDIGEPKALAAARHLHEIDAGLHLEPVVGELTPRTVSGLLDGIDVVVDGFDSFPVRHVLNDACCRAGIPWVHGAVLGAYGLSLTVVPGRTPCLRCLQDQLPTAADSPTCDTAGVLGPAVRLVAAWQAAEAMKLLVGAQDAVRPGLWACDLWRNTHQRLDLAQARDPACATCGPQATWPALAQGEEPAVVLCGRQAVQLRRGAVGDLDRLAARLGVAGNGVFVRWHDGDVQFTCFADGRVLVQGTGDPIRARALCDRWLG
jgi:adenylyltransferase/sulfurtransferase